MTTRTKEEQQLLDEKIARIRKKDEEILRRQKEIAEDKRLAEQQNASVKLRPSTANVSRERTPALKPSNRELREDFADDNSDPGPQRSTRGSARGRGGERYRGQADWKSTGPPPDPKSFLYDDERDAPPRDGKGDQYREPDRGRRGDDRESREEFRGGREHQRGGRWAGGSERGRQGGRGRNSRSEEEAWRAERMRIDEARIQRQMSADGKWRREWDNEKIMQEPPEEPRLESRRPAPMNMEQHHTPTVHHSVMHFPPDSSRRSTRGAPRAGRGRGRLDPTELEMPLETFQLEVLQRQISVPSKSVDGFSFAEDNQRRPKLGGNAPPSPPSPHQDNYKLDPTRSIECVGDTVKISIPNTNVTKSATKPHRSEARGRFRSQQSYSSQSDDDSPRDRGQRVGRRQRSQKYPKNLPINHPDPRTPSSGDDLSVKTTPETLPAQNKPPLPPFRSDQKPSTSLEGRSGDDSWEDVTSGTESLGEEHSSANSSPYKKTISNIVTINSVIVPSVPIAEEFLVTGMTPLDFLQIKPSDYPFDEYLNQIGVLAEPETSFVRSGIGISALADEFNLSKQHSGEIVVDEFDLSMQQSGKNLVDEFDLSMQQSGDILVDEFDLSMQQSGNVLVDEFDLSMQQSGNILVDQFDLSMQQLGEEENISSENVSLDVSDSIPAIDIAFESLIADKDMDISRKNLECFVIREHVSNPDIMQTNYAVKEEGSSDHQTNESIKVNTEGIVLQTGNLIEENNGNLHDEDNVKLEVNEKKSSNEQENDKLLSTTCDNGGSEEESAVTNVEMSENLKSPQNENVRQGNTCDKSVSGQNPQESLLSESSSKENNKVEKELDKQSISVATNGEN